MIDWRLPENRETAFLRWLNWRLRWCDLDHFESGRSYAEYGGMDEEQKFWYALLFGLTYQTEMAWILWWYFPDFDRIDLEKIQTWNVSNLHRQRYAKDTKYNKGRITEQVASMKQVMKGYSSIKDWVYDGLGVDEHQNFVILDEKIQRIHKYGRMTSWLACQFLFELCGVPCRPNSVFPNHDSNWSVRNGLCHLFNRADLLEDWKKNKEELSLLEEKAWELSVASLEREQDKAIFSRFLLETHLCQFKKLIKGGDYPGQASGDKYGRVVLLNGWWPEVDFSAYFKVYMPKLHPLIQGKRESRALYKLCSTTGLMINMHLDFDDVPNVYELYGIDHDWLKPETHNERKIKKCLGLK